jgi:hypothetical protein
MAPVHSESGLVSSVVVIVALGGVDDGVVVDGCA